MPSKKNRDYTGLLRTPPSLAWLIRQRSKLRGRIEALQKKLDAIPAEIEELKETLASLDMTFPLHEVRVEPKVIEGRKPKRASLGPYGALTRHILSVLRDADGPIYTAEIALSFARAFGINLHEIGQATINESVLKRLQDLQRKGVVQRHHPKSTTHQGSWSLVREVNEDSVCAAAA
ncbi:hypothetical protein ACFX58_09480 [Sphingomonas sp. NCPPB 2930]